MGIYEELVWRGLIKDESSPEIKDISDYVSPVRAGYGAMRDIVEEILRRRGDRDAVIKRVIEKMP